MRWLQKIVLITLPLCGCGTYVPSLQEPYEDPAIVPVKVSGLVGHLTCELITSVQRRLIEDEIAAPYRLAENKPPYTLLWLKKWAGQITLTLTVQEKTNFNPNIGLNTIYPSAIDRFRNGNVITGQNFSVGLAGAFSSDATRKETLSYYIDFKSFTDDKSLAKARKLYKTGNLDCNSRPGAFLEGDLKLHEWLGAALLPASDVDGQIPDFSAALSAGAKSLKKDVVSHQVTFVVLYGANITPVLRLVDFVAGQGQGPFLGAQRTNTQDANITLGPAQLGQLSVSAQNTILASQIETSFRNALQSLR